MTVLCRYVKMPKLLKPKQTQHNTTVAYILFHPVLSKQHNIIIKMYGEWIFLCGLSGQSGHLSGVENRIYEKDGNNKYTVQLETN